MSKINGRPIVTIEDFVTTIYNNNKKNIIFWDTCALLEILRFIYKDGDINSYNALNTINALIQSDTIYSIASALTINEWNDNENFVVDEITKSLKLTSKFHKTSIEVINKINTSAYISEPIFNKNLLEDLRLMADSIILKTTFLDTPEIANKALERLSLKKAPASKKNEYKDCAVWESMYLVCEKINNTKVAGDNFSFVFYTVNPNDFIDKSREPKQFHGTLLAEAAVVNMICCQKVEEVYASF